MALVDGNNFYVSCEKLFRPDLADKPVGVLSSNDGCFVSRCQKVKDLGIKMGVPVFQVQQLVKQHDIQLFSSNFPLYADLSARMMATLEEFAPRVEQYSIDEAFLDLTGVCQDDPVAYGRNIKKTVLKLTGIPVCVGMAPTKTLAKLANFAAKKWPKTGGVVDLSDPARREKLMKTVPVGEVWGIGSRTAAKLNPLGIHTVWDLASQPSKRLHSQLNVLVARIVLELNGVPCLELDEMTPDKQQIICSRSFSKRLTHYRELSEAMAEFCSRAGEKLRQQNSVTGHIGIFIRTSPFNPHEPQYQRAAGLRLTSATQDTRVIIATANRLLRDLFKDGYGYHKCGVQLSQLQPVSALAQCDLLDLIDNDIATENRPLMEVMDRINRRFPKAVSIAATGFDKSWKPRAEKMSPRYTTDWQELAWVRCD